MSEDPKKIHASSDRLTKHALGALRKASQIQPAGSEAVLDVIDAIQNGCRRPSSESMGITILFLLEELWRSASGKSTEESISILCRRLPDHVHCAVMEEIGGVSTLLAVATSSIATNGPSEALRNAAAEALRQARIVPSELSEIYPGSGPWGSSALSDIERAYPHAHLHPTSDRAPPLRDAPSPKKIRTFWPEEWK